MSTQRTTNIIGDEPASETVLLKQLVRQARLAELVAHAEAQ
jgi:hypothetical protein